MVDFVPLSGSHLVGRQREQRLIWNHFIAARSGCTRVVLLDGELGIGKTRLLSEIAARTLKDGAVVLRGSSTEAEGMPPYLPFLEALGEYIRVTPLEQLRKQVAHSPQILASIFPELAFRLGDLPELYPPPPEQARLRLYEAIGTFIEAISLQNGFILMLDDLHWADSASMDLLCYIAQHHTKAKLLILGTCREDEIDRNPALGRALNALVRLRVLTRIAVDPLSQGEIEALAVAYLEASISSIVSKLLYEQSEGNPFFAEELIRCWIEAGSLVREHSQWIAGAPTLLKTLPSSIVGVLRQRFSRLSQATIDHLRIAANIGRSFDISLLASVEGLDAETIEDDLHEATRAGLVQVDQNGIIIFCHDKIRECLYAEVSTSRRRRLHEMIGSILEVRYDRNSPKSSYQLAELAFHFTRSGDQVRGATYAQLAAEQALRSFAFDEARNHYRAALELLNTDDNRRGDLLLKLGETSLLVGLNSEAALAYEAALTWLLRLGEPEEAARAAHGLGLANWRQNALHAAQEALERAKELEGDQISADVVLILVDLSMLLTIFLDQHAQGRAHAERALEMARSLGDHRLEATTTRTLVAGKIFIHANDISVDSHLVEQAMALAEESDDPAEAAECCLYLAGTYFWKAEIRRSYSMSLKRERFLERSRQPHRLRNTYAWPALLFSCQGAWAEAEQALQQAQAVVEHRSRPSDLTFLQQIRGFLAYQREDYASAERELQAAMAHQSRSLARLLFHPAGLYGLTKVALGKNEEAHASLAELEAHISELPIDSLPAATSMTCLALMAVALGDRERAATLYIRLLPKGGQCHWLLVDRVLGELASLCGEHEKAMLHLSEAEATARREDLRPELARTLFAQANCEVALGVSGSISHATHLFKQALALFEHLNLSQAAGRIRHQLRLLARPPSRSTLSSLPAGLTRSETRILHLVTQGKNNRQIAGELGLSEKTVANHLSHIFMKTDSENRAAATAFAIRNGLA
jgi:DNA-binding CsgD family transcriptional regulator